MADNTSTDGILIRAQNGDVIRYDDTGLILRLSDTVLADIALRLGGNLSPAAPPVSVPRLDAHAYLPDVDAWGVSLHGDWLYFTANLAGVAGPCGYRRRVTGGDIIADAPGPIQVILGMGGARAALGSTAKPNYPYHILAPADDIGAVGHAGVEDAIQTPDLEHLRDLTHEALVADMLLQDRVTKTQALPLFVTRVETDTSATATDLATGPAMTNLEIAVRNAMQAASSMGKQADITAICLDYTFEDQSGSAAAYRDGMTAVMDGLRDHLKALGHPAPTFVTRFEGGTPAMQDDAIIEGQWDLAWNHADHRFIQSAPSYMFDYDTFDRPTDAARADMAAMTAAAITTDNWHCPTFMLAECISGTHSIRVTAKAMQPLVLDLKLGCTALAGFSLIGNDNAPQITGVAVDPNDPKALIFTCDTAPTGDLHLGYAVKDTLIGGVRDDWMTDGGLHRWALPCLLPVTGTA
ncbi:MAG: hypothetical protein ACPG5U_00100 [Planktomarina sp.]